jgi:phage-related protein
MSWKVIYFESVRGERFVKEFVDKQRSEVRAKYAGMIDFLEKYGPFLSGKYTKKLKKNLYELRITGKEQIRVFYTVRQREIILLHSFKKKTQKTPLKEIKTAILRLDKI